MLQPITVLPVTEAFPDAEAIWTNDRSLSWSQLEARSRQFAQGLRAEGIAEGESWGLLARNQFEWGELTIGNGRAGTRSVPLNWHLTARELTELLEDSQAKLLIVGSDPLDDCRLGSPLQYTGGTTGRSKGVVRSDQAGLASFKIPKSIDVVDALPREASGKLKKHKLRDPYWESEEATTS